MKKSISFFSAALLMVIIFTVGCGEKANENANEKKASVVDTIPVQTVKVEKKDLSISKTFSGTLEGEEQANIVAKIPERIVSIKVKVGDAVSAGQLLIELDKSGASSQYYQAQAGYLNAEKDLQRMKALLSEGAISQQMLDGVQTQFNIAKANFDAAKSAVELTSPIAGVVTALNSNIGDLAVPGMPIIVVASINRMKVIFSVGENDITSFYVGQSTEIYSELKQSLVQKGSISQISKSADIQSRSFEIKSLFSNTSDRWFKPGMFCKVKVNLKSQASSLVIPNIALVSGSESKGVFVIENGKAVYKNVVVGLTDGTSSVITSGLNENEIVATTGVGNLKNGSVVHVAK